MNGFVNAILHGDFENIKTSIGLLDVTLSINNKLTDGNELTDGNKLTDGKTPIYLACEVGNSKIVDYLLKNGAKKQY